jgi:hypothetical protein
MRWVWDTPRDEEEFAEALRALVDDGLPESTDAVIAREAGVVTLVLTRD